MPWLKNKTFFIPALASVLAVSVVGAVLALQAANPTKVSEDASSDSGAIGFACVSGTPICEEVKSILLKTDYDEVVANWTRESLIAHLEYKYGRSRIFATEVVDSIKFDWGDGSSVGACVSGELICDQARYVLITTDQGKQFTREEFISTWMDWYGGTREKVEAIIDELGFTNWAGTGSAKGSAPSRGSTNSPSNQEATELPPALLPQAPVSPTAESTPDQGQTAINRASEILGLWGDSYGPSRLRAIDTAVSAFSFSREEATAAVDSLNIDWYEQAYKMAGVYLSANPCDHFPGAQDMFDVLYEIELFTNDQAWSAVYGHFTDFEQETETIWAMYPSCPDARWNQDP
jgi:hypothetical protein